MNTFAYIYRSYYKRNYGKVNDNTDVKALRGDTVSKMTDRIAFGEVNVKGYSRM